MTLNEIASWLHKEYGVDYRKALSIAGKMINKEGYYSKPIKETKEVAKSRAGVEDDLPVSGGDKLENPDDIFGDDTAADDDTNPSKTLDDWLDSMGKSYIGESGLLGYMASALSEIKNMALDKMSASEAVKKLEDAGYDDEYFNGLFAPSTETWHYRDEYGKIKLYEWRAEVKNICKVLDIDADDSDYYKLTKRYL